MGTITIILPDERLSRLEDRAADLGITVEELVRLSVDELLAKQDEALEQAIGRVLNKNKDLYERLERHQGFGSAKGLIAMTAAVWDHWPLERPHRHRRQFSLCPTTERAGGAT
jgi:hypothetical protein